MPLENFINDLASLFGFGGAGAGGFAVWQSSANKEVIKVLEAKIDLLEISVAQSYTRQELNERFDKLDNNLNRIYDKLEAKADK